VESLASEVPSHRRLPRRRWLAGGSLAIAVFAVLAVILLESRSPRRASADTGVPAGDTTATVTRRTLSEGSTVDGKLGYGGKLELYDRLSGTFTWLPAAGAVIGRGGALFRVDDRPVVLMYGSVPAYRALKQGVSDGPDVAELNANLVALGFDPDGAITDDESFGEATTAAVRRWQKAERLPETGEIELGRIVFAPGARRVTEVHVSLGQDPPGEEPAQPAAESPASPPSSTTPSAPAPSSPAPNPKAPASKAPSSHEPSSQKPRPRKPSSHKPRSHGPASQKQPSSGSGSPSKEPDRPTGKGTPANESADKPSGASGGAGTAVLATTSTRQVVQLAVKAEQQQLAHVGETVPVTLPGGGTVRGRIAHVGTVASEPKDGSGGEKGSPSGEGNESPTVAVTVGLDHPVAHLDQAPVSVELVKQITRHVLTVPATALIATAGGGYAVEALQGGRRVVLAVTPGMFAGGYVQVEGAGVREGVTVIESQ
jgi:peptidoglycan hydrolase-like protein with peptidoglycan-binding domain